MTPAASEKGAVDEPPAPQEPEPERGDLVFRIAILILVVALVAAMAAAVWWMQ
jgi:hypothetical protein